MKMDERSLIINAIKNKDNPTPEEDPVSFPGPDAILDMVKKRKKRESFKNKACVQWNNADFLRYLDATMKEFGVSRITGNTRRDGDYINQLYDKMVKKIGERMNNEVLREYMDWWCSIWAPRLTGSGFHIKNLLKEKHITTFFRRYSPAVEEKQDEPVRQITSEDTATFELGGLPLLSIKRGMVIGYHVANQKLPEPQRALQSVLKDLSKEMLTAVMKATIQNAPYPNDSKFDFFGLAEPFLKAKDILEFNGMSSGQYFEE